MKSRSLTFSVLTLTLAAPASSAATWALSKTGNWSDFTVSGWNGLYPDAMGAVANYDNSNSTANAQITQNIAAGVTVGSISYTGTGTATARTWTIVPTNPITLNEDGAGSNAATITFAANSTANVNDRLIINAGTLTLADDLVISKTSTVSIVANAIQISAAIGGTGRLTLDSVSQGLGNGNIFLSPAAGNTFTGNVLIRNGAITYNHRNAFGNPANVITLGESGQFGASLVATAAVGIVPNPIVVTASAGALTLGSNSTSATANTTFSGTVTAAGLLTLTSASPGTQPVTFTNVISGSGGLAKTGTGTVALNGLNTYSGGTSITAGTLAVGPAGNLGADSTVDAEGNPLVPNNITINGGNLLLSSAANLGSHQEISYIAGGIGVNFTPAATIPVNNWGGAGGVYGINYTGTGGVTNLADLYGGLWSLGSFIGGTYNGTSLGAGSENLYRLGGGGGTLTIQNDVLVGANGLLVAGSGGGRVNLSAANTFTGQTTVGNGTVGISSIGNAAAGPSSLGNPALPESAILLGSGSNAVGINYTGATPASSDRVLTLAGTTGTVTLSNSGTAPIQWTSPLVFTGSGLRAIQLGNNTDTVGGSVIGISDENANKTSLIKAGMTNSTWILTGNTHTGPTKIDGGVLEAALASLDNSYINLDGDDETRYGVLQTSGTLARVQSTTAAPANIKVGANSGFSARGGDLTVTLSGGAQLAWGTGGFLGTGTARLVFGSTTANGKVTFTNPINLNTTDAFQRVFYVEQGAGGDSAELSGVLSPGSLPAPAVGPAPSGLNKIGNGTLILSGANTYLGLTTVSAGKLLINGNQAAATGNVGVNSGGTLGGTGTIGGAITVNAGGVLAPGTSVGTLNAAGSLTFAGPAGSSALAIEVNGANADSVNVTGALNIAVANLIVSQTSAPTASVYIIATYGSIVGAAFNNTTGVPAGYDVVIGHNGLNRIALVKTGAQSPFEQWISSPPNNLTGSAALPGADPDGDGAENLVEFALGGDPTSGSSAGLTYTRMAAVGGTPNVLTLTVAVRTGAAFTAAGNSMQAAIDGITYRAEASNNLADWGTPVVTEVTGTDAATIQNALPVPPSGWVYKTFRTDGSSPTDAGDFLRVGVQ